MSSEFPWEEDSQKFKRSKKYERKIKSNRKSRKRGLSEDIKKWSPYLTDEERAKRKAKVLKREVRQRKIERAKKRNRQKWSLETFEGQQIRKMGFRSSFDFDKDDWYKEYLKTNHWRSIKEKWRKSKKPQCCIVCGDLKFELHHRSYDRIGAEHLSDLVPLCRKHHKQTHKLVKQGHDLWDAHTKLASVV